MLIPFLGGVPATAAIARTSVGIKSGAHTRMTGIVHALGLLGSMFALAPFMSRIPLSALAGVLIVTALRMNEWESIRFMFQKRFKSAMLAFLVTMVCTISLDLTTAILAGVVISAALFLRNSAGLTVQVLDVDPERLREKGIANAGRCRLAKVAYLTGPLFFAAVDSLNTAMHDLSPTHTLILSMRGVPLLDICGVHALVKLSDRLEQKGCTIMLAGVQPQVMKMMERAGLPERIGQHNIFWSADQAIVEAEARGCACG
jgi:SulP family sulfate permease